MIIMMASASAASEMGAGVRVAAMRMIPSSLSVLATTRNH